MLHKFNADQALESMRRLGIVCVRAGVCVCVCLCGDLGFKGLGFRVVDSF